MLRRPPTGPASNHSAHPTGRDGGVPRAAHGAHGPDAVHELTCMPLPPPPVALPGHTLPEAALLEAPVREAVPLGAFAIRLASSLVVASAVPAHS